jgi:hypothetical protein
MPKPRSRRDQNLRLHIAYLAARLMAEDGGLDYGAAKSKAARQAGLSEGTPLPDNQEVEAALREYQSLYQRDDQPLQLRRLREIAVKVMRDFADFRPMLVGSVLSGTAGQHSDVNIQLFTDDPKALALHLLNRRVRFEEGSRRAWRGGESVELPQFMLEVEGVPVTLTVLDAADERSASRPRSPDEPLQRARLPEVEAMLRAGAAPA